MEISGYLIKGLENLFKKSWQNVRHVEAAEIDAVLCPEFQPLKSNNSGFSATVQQQKRASEVSKKEVEPEVDKIDAVFCGESQSSTKPKKPRLRHNTKMSLLGGGGRISGR